jgi:RimJ/RimL family protein N-acetyltransferase
MTHWHDRILGNPESTVRTIDVDGEVAGNIVSWQPTEGERAVGYYLGRAYWGRGVATAALAAFLASHEKRRPLVAIVAEHNVASRRVLEKCGFKALGEPEVSADGVVERTLRLDV